MLLCAAETEENSHSENSWQNMIFNEGFCLFALVIAYDPVNEIS